MTKHPLLFVALLTLLSVVAALIILHFSPGEQGDRKSTRLNSSH